MGRHSRKGRGNAGETSERAAQNGDAADPYSVAPDGRRSWPEPPNAPEPSPQGTGPRGEPAQESPPEGGYAPSARGGHPEQREAGGGWGADGTGQGPAGGRAVGRALQDRHGTETSETITGPRQEYLDAFDDDVFAAGAPGSGRSPGPRDAVRTPELPHRRGPESRVPRPPRAAAQLAPWTDDEQAGAHRQSGARGDSDAYGVDGPGERFPWQRQSRPGRGGGHTTAPSAPLPSPERRTGRGHKGRAITGVAAAAVTTLLAVIIAGQVADGGLQRHTRAAGNPDSDPGHTAADGSASRQDGDARGGREAGAPQSAAQLYAAKMARRYPLAPDFKGQGSFTPVDGHQKGARGGQRLRYRVDVEKGLSLDGALFAEAVHKTLNDKRSWAHGGERSFERVDSGHADFVITLASPATTDLWCAKSGLDTSQERVSCDSASTERVMINAYRWAQGAKTYGHDRIYSYRQMLINHEVGHRLGRNHLKCPKSGALAPVMMQQTKYLTTNGVTCRPNPWPYPRG